jgi:tetratricopeptide (TPR) repeat protein
MRFVTRHPTGNGSLAVLLVAPGSASREPKLSSGPSLASSVRNGMTPVGRTGYNPYRAQLTSVGCTSQTRSKPQMSKPAPQPILADIPRALQQALAWHRHGRLTEAEKIYARILKFAPAQFEALHLLGALKLQTGKAPEAFRLLTAAVKINPRSADALTNLGLVLRARNRDMEALARFDEALALDPAHIEARNNRGLVLLLHKRTEEALACFDEVIRREPRHLARLNRGNALAELGRAEEAVAEYDRVLAAFPNHPGALFNRGNAMHTLGRYAEAVAAFDRALAIVPQHAEAWNNRGIALYALNRHPEALSSYDHALSVRKDYPDAHYNRSLSMLITGDYRHGFEAYEWRGRRTGMGPSRRDLRNRLWLGDASITGKTILLHAEQGLGDTIQFVRYVPLLARAGANVVVEVQPELATLVSALPGLGRIVSRGERLPVFDFHCPLPSLPRAFRTELDSVPAEVPYLRASLDRVERWRPQIKPLPRPRVAVAWSGNPGHANDRHRSIALAQLDPLLSTPGVQFLSVQRDVRDGEAQLLAGGRRIVHLGGELADFADTAAVIALVDLVICVDTAVAHLAGALGKPAWILLPFAPDWRWMLKREDSPWYPTARLFRQPQSGEWRNVIARLSQELSSSGAVFAEM